MSCRSGPPPPPPQWSCDEDTGFILHDFRNCELCSEWMDHYNDDAFNLSIMKAIKDRDHAIQEQALDSVRKELEERRQELAAIRRELEEARKELKEAQPDQARLRGNDNHLSVDRLRDDLQDAAHHRPSLSHSPRRRDLKRARCTRTPSPHGSETPSSPSIVALSPGPCDPTPPRFAVSRSPSVVVLSP